MKNWDEILADYCGSGLSGRSYCREHELNYASFNYHKKKRDCKDSGGKFLAIQTGVPSASMLEVIYPNGVRLRLPASVRLAELKSLLDV